MAEGRSVALWNHTSSVLAMVANVYRDPKKRAMKPADFHPHVKAQPVPKSNVSAAQLSANMMSAFKSITGRKRG